MGRLPIAVDAMGGDHGVAVVVEGAARAHRAGIPVVLVGDETKIRAHIGRQRIDVVHAASVIGMGSGAVASVRRHPNASVRVALRLVAQGKASAAFSCGDTGATLVASVFDLGVLEGVDRPAVATLLPRADGGRLVLLDAGANVDCRPELLACFAQLGAAYAEARGVRLPRIGLLSNGEEDGKGNAQTRETLPLLRELPLQVVGNVEPSAAMEGACDVLVCDGFVGNVLLKAAEGSVSTAVTMLREEVKRRPSGLLGALLLRGAFGRFRKRVAWDAVGGAVLLGTKGLVVIGHGRANPAAVHAAIGLADQGAKAGLVERVARRLGSKT